MAIILTAGFPAHAGHQKKQNAVLTSASLNLATTLGDVLFTANGRADGALADRSTVEAGATTTAWIDTHNAPSFDVKALWTFSTGVTLSFMVWGTNDRNGVIIAPLYNIPAGATDGNNSAYPTLLDFPKGGTIGAGTGWYSGAGTTCYVGFEVFTRSNRFIKLQAMADAAAGSIIAYASPGASS